MFHVEMVDRKNVSQPTGEVLKGGFSTRSEAAAWLADYIAKNGDVPANIFRTR
jgi:hypothetical protein